VSGHEPKRQRQRERQAAYEPRQCAGMMSCPVVLGPDEIDALVRLRWLPASPECSREQVGAPAAAVPIFSATVTVAANQPVPNLELFGIGDKKGFNHASFKCG
jgi:hypothetical protein